MIFVDHTIFIRDTKTTLKMSPFSFNGESNGFQRIHNCESYENTEMGDVVVYSRERITGMMREQRWEMFINHITLDNFIADVALHSEIEPLTLLHIACTIISVPKHVILAIIKLNPNAVLTEDEDGSLPIHLACAFGLSLQVIEALMIMSPKSCFHADHQDEIPMHYILIKRYDSTNIAPRLISRIPSSCIYNDTTSLLHEMRDGICNEETIHQVIRIHPQICHIRNKDGDTLLHVLCYHKRSTLKTIRMVVNFNSQACATTDNDGNLPLHLVKSGKHSEDIIQILLKAHPLGAFTPNIFGATPLFMHLLAQ